MMCGDASSELSPPLVRPASLEMMYTPQLIDDATGFGLGFYVGKYRDHESVQHSGRGVWVYDDADGVARGADWRRCSLELRHCASGPCGA